ncbi:MAG: NAD-dependent epimerase/dehydratase family protein [Acidimicrobiia bacterium]
MSGLARDEQIAARLTRDGYGAVRGTLTEIDVLVSQIVDFDAIVYTPRVSFAEEGQALGPLVGSLEGTGKAFVFVTGTGVMAVNAHRGEWRHEIFAEDDPFVALPWMQQRVDVENAFLTAAQRGVRAMLLRPPHVWGHGNSTLVRGLVEGYRKTGEVNYVGHGLHTYAHVHVDDLGELGRLVVERGVAGGVYNAIGGESDFRTMARATARLLGCEARSITVDQTRAIWGEFMGPILFATSCPARGPRARELGWVPQHVDIEVDIAGGGYEHVQLGESFDLATQKRLGVID